MIICGFGSTKFANFFADEKSLTEISRDNCKTVHFNCSSWYFIEQPLISLGGTIFIAFHAIYSISSENSLSLLKPLKEVDVLANVSYLMQSSTFTCIITSKSTLLLFYSTDAHFYLACKSQISPPNICIKSVACGHGHVLALSNDGLVYVYGDNRRSQLADVHSECNSITLLRSFPPRTIFQQIAAGGWHSATLTDDGDVYTWGWNLYGQVGVNPDDTQIVSIPMVVTFPTDGSSEFLDISKIGCGSRHSIALGKNGRVYSWGWNKYGQLCRNVSGDFDYIPAKSAHNNVIDISVGPWTTLIF